MTRVPSVQVRLVAGRSSAGKAVLESVPAVQLEEPRTFRLLASPGLVEGVAAEDVVRVGDGGSITVLSRGGNLAVWVFAKGLADAAYAPLEAEVRELGGYLDGGSDDSVGALRVFTIPVAAGFPAVEAAFNSFVAENPDAEWYFGNVYDPADGVTPLGWWEPS